MDREPTPPAYDDIPQTPRAKLDFEESGEARDHHLANNDLLSPHVTATKFDNIPIEGIQRLTLSPAPSRSLTPVPIDSSYGSESGLQGSSKTLALKRFWQRNMPAILVATSQFFGALMNLTARLLEFEGEGMHPVQVLILRQSVTVVCCCIYMWWTKVPGFPYGTRDLQFLLFFRGFSGFFGIFGMWYSMMYLPLADATVITFLAPGVAGFLCWFVLHEPFTRMERYATLIALFGVILIAQPTAFFTSSPEDDSETSAPPEKGLPGADHEATPEERLIAVGVALLGVFGAAGAFTSLRTIGKRAHPLISVNYFGTVSSVICLLALCLAPVLDIDQPALRWVTPTSVKQWVYLFLVGVFGFTMQYLLTAGLGSDKSNRANSMVYTHMLFAAAFDRWVFGHEMNFMSFAGCTLILGSAIGVVLAKRGPVPKTADDVERQGNLVGETEGAPMLLNAAGNADELGFNRGR